MTRLVEDMADVSSMVILTIANNESLFYCSSENGLCQQIKGMLEKTQSMLKTCYNKGIVSS